MTKDANHVQDILNVADAQARRFQHEFLPFGKSFDELKSDFYWIILDEEEKRGYDIDIPLMIDIIEKRRQSIKRAMMHRAHDNYDDWQNDVKSSEESGRSYDGAGLHSHISNDFSQNVMIDNLLNMYEENTKERIFIEFFLEAAGLYEFGNKYGFRYSTKSQNAVRDERWWMLSQYLGYGRTDLPAFRNLKKKMIDKIAKYFDVDLSEYKKFKNKKND